MWGFVGSRKENRHSKNKTESRKDIRKEVDYLPRVSPSCVCRLFAKETTLTEHLRITVLIELIVLIELSLADDCSLANFDVGGKIKIETIDFV